MESPGPVRRPSAATNTGRARATGPLSVTIGSTCTNVAATFRVGLTTLIDGQTTASVWDFGDGTVASNQPYTTHAWAAPGDYEVVLRAHNDSGLQGASATQTVHVVAQPVHYVAVNGSSPASPVRFLGYGSHEHSGCGGRSGHARSLDPGEQRSLCVRRTGGAGHHHQPRGGAISLLPSEALTDLSLRSCRATRSPGTTNGESAIRCVYLTNGAGPERVHSEQRCHAGPGGCFP